MLRGVQIWRSARKECGRRFLEGSVIEIEPVDINLATHLLHDAHMSLSLARIADAGPDAHCHLMAQEMAEIDRNPRHDSQRAQIELLSRRLVWLTILRGNWESQMADATCQPPSIRLTTTKVAGFDSITTGRF